MLFFSSYAITFILKSKVELLKRVFLVFQDGETFESAPLVNYLFQDANVNAHQVENSEWMLRKIKLRSMKDRVRKNTYLFFVFQNIKNYVSKYIYLLIIG